MDKKGLTGGEKFCCVVAGFLNFVLGFTCFFVFRYDKDDRHKDFANCMRVGAIIGVIVALIWTSVVSCSIVGIPKWGTDYGYDNFYEEDDDSYDDDDSYEDDDSFEEEE